MARVHGCPKWHLCSPAGPSTRPVNTGSVYRALVCRIFINSDSSKAHHHAAWIVKGSVVCLWWSSHSNWTILDEFYSLKVCRCIDTLLAQSCQQELAELVYCVFYYWDLHFETTSNCLKLSTRYFIIGNKLLQDPIWRNWSIPRISSTISKRSNSLDRHSTSLLDGRTINNSCI